jgi:hypothetical protein
MGTDTFAVADPNVGELALGLRAFVRREPRHRPSR